MKEDGSSYTGSKKEFLSGSPLNIAAMRFGPDGHMYFIVGGRNSASKLYRIKYVGPKTSEPVIALNKNQKLRNIRHSLEKYHDKNKGGIELTCKQIDNGCLRG